jgi:hypothetical protein
MKTRYFNHPCRRLTFAARPSSDEDDEQIETWMIGSGSEPSGSSLRGNVPGRGFGMT